MKVSAVVGGVVAALVVVGCARRVEVEDKPPPPSTVGDYYPLAVGNSWTYAVNGRVDKQVEVRIVKEEGGFFHDSQGGQLTVDTFGVKDQKRYLLRTPVEAGHKWTNVVSVSSAEHYEIRRVGVSCQAPAGAFPECVQVEARNRVDKDTTLVNTFTFARGVGLVRMQLEAEREGRRIPQTWLELTSYQVKPAGG